jgi:hypothetical protein
MAGDDPRPSDDSTRPLGRLVEQEARRVLSEATLAPDPARLADGWERRFIADGRRAEEAMALYRELGFEVVADPLRPEDMPDDCDDCQLLATLRFRTIYTRRPRPPSPGPGR